MDRKKDIIKIIEKMSGQYAPYEVFSDWIRCCALMIENSLHPFFHNKVWEMREKEFTDTMARYPRQHQNRMAEMLAMLAETAEEGMTDILGQIYMEAGMGSKQTGQFFTPFHVAEMTARCGLQDIIKNYNGETISLNEPAAGGGAMMIAAAKVLHDAGIDYQRKMDVVAQDLDWKGVYMTYVQLSLYGIKAIVVQGDTLADPYVPGRTEPYRILRTPAKAGALI